MSDSGQIFLLSSDCQRLEMKQDKYPSTSEVMAMAVESLRLREAPDADTEESTIWNEE